MLLVKANIWADVVSEEVSCPVVFENPLTVVFYNYGRIRECICVGFSHK